MQSVAFCFVRTILETTPVFVVIFKASWSMTWWIDWCFFWLFSSQSATTAYAVSRSDVSIFSRSSKCTLFSPNSPCSLKGRDLDANRLKLEVDFSSLICSWKLYEFTPIAFPQLQPFSSFPPRKDFENQADNTGLRKRLFLRVPVTLYVIQSETTKDSKLYNRTKLTQTIGLNKSLRYTKKDPSFLTHLKRMNRDPNLDERKIIFLAFSLSVD